MWWEKSSTILREGGVYSAASSAAAFLHPLFLWRCRFFLVAKVFLQSSQRTLAGGRGFFEQISILPW